MHNLRKIFQTLLDLVFPRNAKDRALAACTKEKLSEKIHIKEENDVRILFNYRDPQIRHLIWSLKYKGNKHAAKLAAEVLADVLLEELAEERLFSEKPPLLVPIPLTEKRLRERGFHQILPIIDGIKPILGNTSSAPNALKKVHETVPQTSLKRAERLENMHGVFMADRSVVQDKLVLLFDDVMTTGATMRAGKAALLSAGAKEVRCFALAH